MRVHVGRCPFSGYTLTHFFQLSVWCLFPVLPQNVSYTHTHKWCLLLLPLKSTHTRYYWSWKLKRGSEITVLSGRGLLLFILNPTPSVLCFIAKLHLKINSAVVIASKLHGCHGDGTEKLKWYDCIWTGLGLHYRVRSCLASCVFLSLLGYNFF